eukprot:Rhum_TRINITY_DN23586_c0_g1::Rhum_TRINITY_DN23586_c0_g1_i1::g.178343::m.178343
MNPDANPYSSEANMFVGAPMQTSTAAQPATTAAGGGGDGWGNEGGDDLFAGLETTPAADENPFAAPAPPPPAASAAPPAGGEAYGANPWDSQGFLQQGVGSGETGYFEDKPAGGQTAAEPSAPPPAVPVAAPAASAAPTVPGQYTPPAIEDPNAPDAPEAAAGAEAEGQTEETVFKVAFYQKYFQVDTVDVVERLKWAMLFTTPRYLKPKEERGPGNGKVDMYGPIWVSTTLWVVLAVADVLAAKWEASADGSDTSGSAESWNFDFTWVLVSIAAAYSYVVAVPLLSWCFLKFNDVGDLPFTKMVCLYGYAFLPMIIGAVVTVVPLWPVKVAAIVIFSLYSFASIETQVWKHTSALTNSWKIGFHAMLLVFHVVVTVLLFFEILLLSGSSSSTPAPGTLAPAPLTTAPLDTAAPMPPP